MESTHEALLSIRVFSNKGIDVIKTILEQLQKEIDIVTISSIFKVNRVYQQAEYIHDIKRQEHFIGLSTAIVINTPLSPRLLISILKKIEQDEKLIGQHSRVKLNILTFDNLIKMTPSLTIPHPEFHLRPEEIFPAAEIYGDFMHPILKMNLTTLCKKSNTLKWGEFFAQGRSLISDPG